MRVVAVEQPGAEPVLQRLDVVAHHRGRHVELAAGGGKAAGIHDPDEGGQTGQAIHRARSDYQRWLDNASSFIGIIDSGKDIASKGPYPAPLLEGRECSTGGRHVGYHLCP